MTSAIFSTGFAPFNGRHANGSIDAARALGAMANVPAIEVPVEWGGPAAAIALFCEQQRPARIVAFGEGHPGVFQIETIANNRRAVRADMTGALPACPVVDPTGPERLFGTADAPLLQRRLREFPIRVSTNAGGYLCEEMLYTLLQWQRRLPVPRSERPMVVFIHVPPLGSAIRLGGVARTVDEPLLSHFGQAVYRALVG
jgi:pyrrolidone-carboxylate peptidase